MSAKEFKRYLSIAVGSANEIRVWLRYALDLGYIEPHQWEYYKGQYLEISKMLTVLHRSWQ